MPTADDLIDALWDAANADPALTALAGRAGWLWTGEAAADTPLPYGVVIEVDATDQYESAAADGSRDVLALRTIQASVYATSRAAARDIAARLVEVWDTAALTFSDGLFAGLYHTGTTTNLDPDRGPAGEDVWQAVARFSVTTEHERG